MRQRSLTILTAEAVLAAALAACGSSSPSSGSSAPASETPVQNTPGAAPSTPAPAASTPEPTTSVTAAATTLDPCQVVTAAEAGALAGATFGNGIEEQTGANDTGKRCTYGSQTTNVFFVQVGVATDAQAAQAEWTREQAQLQAELAQMIPGAKPALKTTDIQGLGDRAVVATLNANIGGQSINGTTLAVLKGATLLAFGDLVRGTAAPTSAAMQAQAKTSLARLP